MLWRLVLLASAVATIHAQSLGTTSATDCEPEGLPAAVRPLHSRLHDLFSVFA